MAGNTKQKRQNIADTEYARLVGLYRAAGVDDIKLKINDSLIRKVAETFAVLESIKDLPTIIYNPQNPYVQRETAAGKARVKYMAQYTSAMQKLNKEMLGTLAPDDEGGLDDYE
jgi:hypothetical protein